MFFFGGLLVGWFVGLEIAKGLKEIESQSRLIPSFFAMDEN